VTTEFYWDKKQKKIAFERRLEGVDDERYLRYVFTKKNLIEFLKSKRARIIWDEYGIPYTVASMLKEIYQHGIIVLVEEELNG